MSLLMGVVMSLCVAKCLGQTPLEAGTSTNSIVIESDDGAEWDSVLGVAVFRGHVKVTDSTNMVLTCDLLTAHFAINTSTNASTNTIANPDADTSKNTNTNASTDLGLGSMDTIVAERNVVIDLNSRKGKGHATGDKLVYVAATDLLTLSGNVILDTAQGRITAPSVIMDRKTGKYRIPNDFKFVSSSNVTTKPFFPQITNKSK